jgi:2-keto-4-pentenoate hydratase/2-oxohepta-3-ene-1,7-dioic acid hydratase in catechol pathway
VKLAAFRRIDDLAGVRRVGVVIGDRETWWLHPLPGGTGLVELLAADPSVREEAADHAVQSDGLLPHQVALLAPVYPVAMRDFLTFEAHVEGVSKGMQGATHVLDEWYQAPSFLFMAPHSVHGPYEDVAMPPDTERLDFELEIAAVICRDVRNVTPEQARAAIGGYCVMNDWSATCKEGK